MTILVSACLLGENCKYNGGNNYRADVAEFLKDKKIVAVCPEVMGGLPVPRACVELKDGKAVDQNGVNVHTQFCRGVQFVLDSIESMKIDFAILQSRSPSCGVNERYDGTFTGKRINGMGLLAQALADAGVQVMDVEDFGKKMQELSKDS